MLALIGCKLYILFIWTSAHRSGRKESAECVQGSRAQTTHETIMSSDKDHDFSSLAKVLGIEYDLRETKLGLLVLRNTAKRVEDVSAEIQKHLEADTLSMKDGERLRGRLQFMDGQLFGKLAQLAYKSLSRHVASGGGRLNDRTRAHLRFIRDRIQSGKPKLVSCRLRETLHICVDACHEEGHEHPAGFGGVLVDESGNQVSYFSELIEADSLRIINAGESQNPIFELECLAILMAVKLWRTRCSERHVVIFTDNNGALGSMIKGYSDNECGARIVHLVHAVLDQTNSVAWFERVSSASNIADAPSRGDITSMRGARFRCDPVAVYNSCVGD